MKIDVYVSKAEEKTPMNLFSHKMHGKLFYKPKDIGYLFT